MKGSISALYEDLKRQILIMELDPDEALDDVVISERYGLSRTPVREVFRRLAGARIGNAFFRPQNGDVEKRLEQSAGHHDAFIEAIERRDESAVVDLVFEHGELSRENMEIFIAPQGIKADARVDLPPNSHSEHLS
ncbi:GntR family transcriptional regulator [Pseudomonas sp. CT11-2]|uniref:GntR family transcriptional regulator n=1 Tax=Pseudomonas sp. CT11-2 TaxID=3243023 RepID=UPI0039AFFE16